MLLSVILPVYNDAKFLEKTLQSLYKQTLNNREYELIIINDGSSDNTLNISIDFFKKHPNLNGCVYTQNNKGVCAARNRGIKLAKGKYIMFVDGDDILANNCLERMLSGSQKKENIELVSCLMTRNINLLGNNAKGEPLIRQCNDMYNYMLSNVSVYGGNVCNKIFKLKIIKNNNISFNEQITYWEDMLFVEKYLQECNGNVFLLNTYLYFYRRNSESVTYTKNKMKLAKNIYSKAIVSYILFSQAKIDSELYKQGLNIYEHLLVDYKILYFEGVITQEQYMQLYNHYKIPLKNILTKMTIKKKIKYYFFKEKKNLLRLRS